MPRVVFSPRAEEQMVEALAFTFERFGEPKYLEYLALIRFAIESLEKDSAAGRQRPEIHPDAWTLHVEERLWEGVYNHSSAAPENLGNALLQRIRTLDGDLRQFVSMVRRTTGWRCYESGERLDDPPDALLRSDQGGADNGLYCYVLDMEHRRLDVFATASGQSRERVASVAIALDGTPTPAAFEPGLVPDPEQEISPPSPLAQ